MKMNTRTSLGTVKQEKKSPVIICIMVYNTEKDVVPSLAPLVKSILSFFRSVAAI